MAGLIVLGLLGGVAVACQTADRRGRLTSSPLTAAAPADGRPAGVPGDAVKGTVAYVIDGDTLMVKSSRWENTRLLGIDAPEIKHRQDCYGPEAKAELQRLAPRQSTVWLGRDQQLRDRFERDLHYLWDDKGLFINLEMVRRGFARTLFVKPNFGHFKEIRAAQDAAERMGSGLWTACKGKPWPSGFE